MIIQNKKVKIGSLWYMGNMGNIDSLVSMCNILHIRFMPYVEGVRMIVDEFTTPSVTPLATIATLLLQLLLYASNVSTLGKTTRTEGS